MILIVAVPGSNHGNETKLEGLMTVDITLLQKTAK